MVERNFGVEELTDEDRAYRGTRFRDVVEALLENPYQRVWGASGEPALPVYEVTLASLPEGMFHRASARAVDSAADLRWGPDRKGYRRLLHPNGVCLIGQWQIAERTEYSGYFAAGSRALTVARYSPCCTETRRGHMRSLAMVGKLFPTTDPDHPAPLRTASFITQEDLGGGGKDFINDVELRNAPDTTASRRGHDLPILLTSGLIFNAVDKQPTIRQLYPIAELGKPSGEPTRAPAFMRLLVAPDQPRISGDELDVRDEVLAQIFDRGDPSPKRTLRFNIEVTDDGTTSGPPVQEVRTFQNWRSIGTLTFENAVASYNGDFVIHFNHPTWREDRNDPSTATRVDGRKVTR